MPGSRNIQESSAGVDLPVAISEGGTGATSAAAARTALGVAPTSHTHAEADVTGLVADLAAKFVPNKVILKKTDGTWTTYATPALAKAAYSSGDTACVGPGTYNATNLLADNLNWELAPGAKIVQTSGTSAIFDDSSTGADGTVTCSIGGFGYFDQQTSNLAIFKIANASKISFAGDKLIASGTSAKVIDQSGGGSEVHVEANVITPGGGTTFSLTGSGAFQDVECLLLGAEGGGGSGATISLSVSSSIQSISAGRVSILGNISAAGTSQQIVEFGAVDSASNCTISNTTARQTVEFSATRTAGFGLAAITQTGSGSQFIQADMLDITGAGISCSNGSQFVEADTISGTNASNPVVTISGGTQLIATSEIKTSTGGQYAVTGTAGTQRLKSTRVTNTGTNGVPLNLGGQTCIIDVGGSLIAASGASVCANAASARDLLVYGTLVSNKPLDTDITIKVGTFIEDANVV